MLRLHQFTSLSTCLALSLKNMHNYFFKNTKKKKKNTEQYKKFSFLESWIRSDLWFFKWLKKKKAKCLIHFVKLSPDAITIGRYCIYTNSLTGAFIGCGQIWSRYESITSPPLLFRNSSYKKRGEKSPVLWRTTCAHTVPFCWYSLDVLQGTQQNSSEKDVFINLMYHNAWVQD